MGQRNHEVKAILEAIRNLVGNKPAVAILIATFVTIFCLLAWRCSSAAELDLRGGVAFGHTETGAVLGLNLYVPVSQIYVYAGTDLWGATHDLSNNWDWHGGLRACRWSFCASLGAAYLQRVDALNGAHTNFNLELSYRPGWWRIASLDYCHLSDAGTTPINIGRNAALVSIRLQ